MDESERVVVDVSKREVVAVIDEDVVDVSDEVEDVDASDKDVVIVVSDEDVADVDVADGDIVRELYTSLDELVQLSRLSVLDRVGALASAFEVVAIVLEESV